MLRTLGAVSALAAVVMAGCAGNPSAPSISARWQRSIDSREIEEAIGVTVSAGVISVADPKQGAILRFGSGGTLQARWQHEGVARPMHIAAGADGRIYVPDHLNDQVLVFDSAGNVAVQFGDHGTGPGQFDSPAGVAVASDGSVYVADFNNHRVQKFDANGQFVLAWGDKGQLLPGNFDYPTDVAIGPDGRVYVADAYNHRVQVFTPDGAHVRSIGSNGTGKGEFDVAIGVAVDQHGRLFVADQFNHRIQVFDTDGAWLGAFGSEGAAQGQFDRPNDVAFDADDRVYVADFGNGRVQVFAIEELEEAFAAEQVPWNEIGASRSSLGRWWH